MQYDPNTYTRNEMDISHHQATFAGFLRWAGYITIATIGVLLFLLLVGT